MACPRATQRDAAALDTRKLHPYPESNGTDDLIQEAVARMLVYNAWFKEQVQIGIAQIARGAFIEEDEMDARVKRILEPCGVSAGRPAAAADLEEIRNYLRAHHPSLAQPTIRKLYEWRCV